jgi:hypothetical protein
MDAAFFQPDVLRLLATRGCAYWSCPGSVDGELLARASLYCPRGG